MQIGVTFPQTEIGADPGAVRAFVQAAEELGYDYLQAYDHVLGADMSVRPDWRPRKGLGDGRPAYTSADMFHEVFVLFGFLASFTTRIGFATGVLVLGQRQTALVAKQAAEIDVLSGGRLRLGIGAGWNDVEFAALGMDYHTRGARNEEQVALLRALWTQEVVTFEGRWHKVTAAGINPLPVQRPIPIWFGGHAEVTLKRAGRLGDGIYYGGQGGDYWAAIERMRGYAREAGRDPSKIGIEGGALLSMQSIEQAVRRLQDWTARGGTHFSLQTMNAGFKTPDQHIDAIRRFREAIKAASIV